MTINQAMHLIEQFAAQAPFAVWVTDSRGIAVFANHRIHEMFKIPEHPSGALGVNVLDDPALKTLGLAQAIERLRNGEIVDVIIKIPDPAHLATNIVNTLTDPLTIRATMYALRSAAQKAEHYVIIADDVTGTYQQREELRDRMRDLSIFTKSKETRLDKLNELKKEADVMRKEILAIGAKPVA